MRVPFLLITGVIGAGAAALALFSLQRRQYTRGLIAGDSMVASPVLTSALEQLTGHPWDNVAVVGRNSEAILQQLTNSLDPERHDVVVVSAGGNDGARSLEWTQRNLADISSLVRSRGAALVILTEPPFRGYRGAQAEAIQRSERSRAWTLQGGVAARRVIDLHDVIGDGAGRIRPEYDGGDGLHPNRAGRVALAQAIARGGA